LEVPLKESQNDLDEQNSKAGRIDFVIQTDNAIIGIENKLDASFQPGQPQKYISGLEQLAKSQGDKGKKYILVILAPRDRNAEIMTKLSQCADTSHYIQLDWEDVLSRFKIACSTNSDRISETVIDQLQDYIANNRRIWPNELYAHHLRGTFDPKGVHGEFIRKLTHIFPGKGRLGTGQKSIGYALDMSRLTDSFDQLDRAWFGFVRRDLLKDPINNTELILATTIAPKGVLPPELRSVHMNIPWWEKPMYTLAVDYDDNDSWKQAYTWSKLFDVLVSHLN